MSLTSIDTIGQLILHQGESASGAAAILAPDRQPLSYAGLAGQLPLVERALRRVGVGRKDRVAVVLPDGPEMAAAFLTVSACAVFAPLNPACGTQEFEFYLDDLQPRAVVLPAGRDSPARAVARARRIPVIELCERPNSRAGDFHLDDIKEPVADLGWVPDLAGPDDVALVLHTSGTTSRPKLVPLTHRNLSISAGNIVGTLKLTPGDRALSIMPLFHTHGLIGVVLSSIASGGGVICTAGFNPIRFFEWLAVLRPTWYSAVPTMHQSIVAGASQMADAIRRSPLRFIRSTSSALSPVLMRELEHAFGSPVIEAYGMTESSQITSNPLPPGERKPGSVGRAAGQDVAVMDQQGRLQPAGKAGEIVIRGKNVTRGYENNPEANGAAFVDGWFRTGDQGRLDAEGYLFITGRLKEFINRGGEKIAPGEIDDALLALPGVREAVAFAIPHPTLGEDVAAAVVAKDEAILTEAELRQSVGLLLSASKVPSRIVIIKAIPKGATGKVQRIGLANRLARELSTTFEAPREGLERMIADKIEQTLGRSPAGRHDNFFALGGDSIAATQVQVRLVEHLGFEIPEVALFNHPTVAQLAVELARLQEQVLEALASDLAGLPPEEAARILSETGNHDS